MAIKNQKAGLKARQDEVLEMLKAMPYDKVNNYVDTNVTSLATAKAYLKKLTKIVLYILKEY